MRFKISVATCAVLALFVVQANATKTTKLQGVEVNSVGDNISESGIDEGILDKRVACEILGELSAILIYF